MTNDYFIPYLGEVTSKWTSMALLASCLQDRDLIPELTMVVDPGTLDPPYNTALFMLMNNPSLGMWQIHTECPLPLDFRDTWQTEFHPMLHWREYVDGHLVVVTRQRLASHAALVAQVSGYSDLLHGLDLVAASYTTLVETGAKRPTVGIEDTNLINFVAPPEDILIPGLLARQARVMITGFEGDGKSIMLRQLALAGALGVHPFDTTRTIEPIDTLYVDLENPQSQTELMMHMMIDTLKARGAVSSDLNRIPRGHYDIHPAGLDVVGRAADRQYLTNLVREHKPDLLCIGPVYRLAAGGGDLDEATAGKVMDYLNYLRVTYNMAVVVEAHAPHGMGGAIPNANRGLRPSGSSAWMRYPEVGRGLRFDATASDYLHRATYELEAWRKDRAAQVRFPKYVAKATGGHVWFDDVTEQVEAQMGR